MHENNMEFLMIGAAKMGQLVALASKAYSYPRSFVESMQEGKKKRAYPLHWRSISGKRWGSRCDLIRMYGCLWEKRSTSKERIELLLPTKSIKKCFRKQKILMLSSHALSSRLSRSEYGNRAGNLWTIRDCRNGTDEVFGKQTFCRIWWGRKSHAYDSGRIGGYINLMLYRTKVPSKNSFKKMELFSFPVVYIAGAAAYTFKRRQYPKINKTDSTCRIFHWTNKLDIMGIRTKKKG